MQQTESMERPAWSFADNYFPKSSWWRATHTLINQPVKKHWLLSKAIKWGKASAGQLTEEEETGCLRTPLHFPHPLAWKSNFGLGDKGSTTTANNRDLKGTREWSSHPLLAQRQPNALCSADTSYLCYPLGKKILE